MDLYGGAVTREKGKNTAASIRDARLVALEQPPHQWPPAKGLGAPNSSQT